MFWAHGESASCSTQQGLSNAQQRFSLHGLDVHSCRDAHTDVHAKPRVQCGTQHAVSAEPSNGLMPGGNEPAMGQCNSNGRD